MSNLRAIKVTYSDGTVECVDVAASLTDKQMLDYFRPGKVFNLSSEGDDNLQYVVSREILK